MIYSSDGQVYEDATQHQLDVPKPSKSDEAPITPSSEDVKSMTHEKPEGKLQTPLLTHLSNKLLETNKTIGDLMTGRLDVNSPEGAYAAVDLAFKTAGYGMLGAEMSAYNKGLGIFGGRMSTAARFTAEQMEKSSKFTDEQIKRWTGLERGTEGMWRKEFSDVESKLNIPREKYLDLDSKGDLVPTEGFKEGSYKLGDIYKHDRLYKAYPEFKDAPVHVFNLPISGSRGWYDSSDKSITLNTHYFEDTERMKSTLLHELQHKVQEHEGFNMGHVSEELNDAIDAVAKIPPDKRTAGEQALWDRYYNQTHEVEARNVQARATLSQEKISRSLGRETENVDRSKQILYDKYFGPHVQGTPVEDDKLLKNFLKTK